MYFNPLSVYGLFDRGVVQMKDAPGGHDFFGTDAKLMRLYALGHNAPGGC